MIRRMGSMLMLLILLSGPTGLALAAVAPLEEGERLGKTCAGCHGTAGASPGELIPIIGGQLDPYLLKALSGFKAQERPGSVMLNIAKGYDDAGLQAMSLWFSAQPWVNSPHAAGAEAVEAGAGLVKGCAGCHGGSGKGQAMFPRLAGQAPEYLLRSLHEYRDGQRTAPEMALVKNLPAADLETMALYYSALK